MNKDVSIRNLWTEDAAYFAAEERAQGWEGASPEKLQGHMKDMQAGISVTLVAEYQGVPAGYVTVHLSGREGPQEYRGYPYIQDLNVLEKFRRKGVGCTLMDAAEAFGFRFADRVYLGVGLHEGYGSAQRMYVKRGYIPDGSGVWYGEKVCGQYEPCCNDDDLVLYLAKAKKAAP